MTELQLNIERHESMIRFLENGNYKNLKHKTQCEEKTILLKTELNILKEQQNQIERKNILESSK